MAAVVRSSKRAVFWIAFASAVGVVVCLSLPHHPGYQEWRCRGRGLAELQALQHQLPESPVVLYYLGRALHQAGRNAEAVPILQRAATLDGDSVRVRETLAEAQLAAGQTRETFDLLRRFLETHPETPEAYQMLGRFLLGVQTYSRAIIVLEEATKRFPDDGSSWMLLASARQQFRDLRGAQEAAARAAALRPTDADTLLLQARILRDRGIPDARVVYEKAVRLAPDDVELTAEFADYLVRRAESPQDLIFATDLARRVLQQNPGHTRASTALGLALAERGQLDEAIPLLRQAVTPNQGDVRVLRTLSRLYQRKGDAAEATRWAEAARRAQVYRDEEKRLLEALETRPNNVILLRDMAQLTGRNGDVPRSVRFHAMALDQPPDAAAPLLATARDLLVGGLTDAARQVAGRSLQNSRTPEERSAAEAFLRSVPGNPR